MSYYFSKTIKKTYEQAQPYVEEKLKMYGFGVVTELEMHKKFKKKLHVDFRPYKILGACSPKHAYEAVTAEEHIGLMLPCNVVIQDKGNDQSEISAIDPIASMQAIHNVSLEKTAAEIRRRLKEFVDSL
ncbi:MAG: DUF302 domain-containing protein [Bacteroidales bacterium]|nr:DUF302 domain-containing protein [Bacteroidales bacterium]